MPIHHGRRLEFVEEKRIIVVEQDFFNRFTVFNAQLDAARLHFCDQLAENLMLVPHRLLAQHGAPIFCFLNFWYFGVSFLPSFTMSRSLSV